METYIKESGAYGVPYMETYINIWRHHLCAVYGDIIYVPYMETYSRDIYTHDVLRVLYVSTYMAHVHIYT